MSIWNGPSEGDWSAFASKVVEERDESLEENKRLQAVICEKQEEIDRLYDIIECLLSPRLRM